MPSFEYENPLWQNEYLVAGVDEVGRGALAGPVVTGLVIFPSHCKIDSQTKLIKDSKKLSHTQRLKASELILTEALFATTGHASVREINRLGIVKATNLAHRRAIAHCPHQINHLLTDAFAIPRVKGIPNAYQTPIIKGDNLSLSIAAASIIAKLKRDNIMGGLHQKNAHYNWKNNKGYGTKQHLAAIANHGPSIHHRIQFISNLSSSPPQSGA